MANKEDLRVRRTKAALFDAFIQLINAKTFDEITVNELCDTAGVRRATFYKHYADKFDFLTAYTRLLRDDFDKETREKGKPALTSEYFVAYAQSIVHYINDNSTAIDNLCKNSLFPSVFVTIFSQNYRDTMERLKVGVSDGLVLPASIETVTSMCVGGVAGCIYSWLANGKKQSAEVVADQIGAVISRILSCN